MKLWALAVIVNVAVMLFSFPLPQCGPVQEEVARDEPTKDPIKAQIDHNQVYVPQDFKDHQLGEGIGKYRAVMLTVNHRMKALGDVSMPNHREYCEHHNLKYRVLRPGGDFDTTYAGAWGKLVGLRNALLDGWEYAIWIDADAVFTNMTDDLLQHVDREHDFFMSKDFNGLNSGVMIVRNTAWASMYLEYLHGFKDTWPTGVNPCFRYEQRGFALTYDDICFRKKNPTFPRFPHADDVRRRIKIVPSNRFNTYECFTPACKASKWHAGDTVFHVPGMGNKDTRIKNKLKSLGLLKIRPN
jgi:hypothetical protein